MVSVWAGGAGVVTVTVVAATTVPLSGIVLALARAFRCWMSTSHSAMILSIRLIPSETSIVSRCSVGSTNARRESHLVDPIRFDIVAQILSRWLWKLVLHTST